MLGNDTLIVDCSELDGGADTAWDALTAELGHACVDIERGGVGLRNLVEQWENHATDMKAQLDGEEDAFKQGYYAATVSNVKQIRSVLSPDDLSTHLDDEHPDVFNVHVEYERVNDKGISVSYCPFCGEKCDG